MFSFSLGGLDFKDSGVDKLREPEGGPEVARSKAYALMAMAYYVPDDKDYERITSGQLQSDLDELACDLPFAIDLTLAKLPEDWSSEDYHTEFLRIFEVGQGGPPCPLFGGTYGGDRMRILEEVMRFYKYFGLKTSDERRIPPDHLATELEFLHYLSYRQAAALLPTIAAPYRQAQGDFIDRQPGGWVPKMAEQLAECGPPDFLASLVDLTVRFLEADRQYLTSSNGSGS